MSNSTPAESRPPIADLIPDLDGYLHQDLTQRAHEHLASVARGMQREYWAGVQPRVDATWQAWEQQVIEPVKASGPEELRIADSSQDDRRDYHLSIPIPFPHKGITSHLPLHLSFLDKPDPASDAAIRAGEAFDASRIWSYKEVTDLQPDSLEFLAAAGYQPRAYKVPRGEGLLRALPGRTAYAANTYDAREKLLQHRNTLLAGLSVWAVEFTLGSDIDLARGAAPLAKDKISKLEPNDRPLPPFRNVNIDEILKRMGSTEIAAAANRTLDEELTRQVIANEPAQVTSLIAFEHRLALRDELLDRLVQSDSFKRLINA